MSKLSLMDQAFYKLETNGMSPALMGGAMILDPSDSPYPMNGKIVADHLAARMEQIPLMRQKLVQDGLKIGSMRLVDDPDFNVKNHITFTKLKAPGGYTQLTECLGEFSAQPLDLTRPLWHYEVIEGLKGGRIAIAMHLHHSILDGVGATQALGCIWDTKPVAAEQPVDETWQAEAEPTPFDLLRDALQENAERLYVKAPLFLMKSGKPMLKMALKSISSTLSKSPVEQPAREKVKVPKVFKTSLNGKRLSAKRAVSYVEFPIDEIKALSRHFDCSINDLLLLLNSYALEYYFDHIGEEISFDLVAGMPINLRAEGDDSKGNDLTVARLSLHNQISDINARLSAIVADTRIIKSSSKPKPSSDKKQAKVDAKALMGLFSPIVLDAFFYSVVKFNLTDKAVLVNLAITNVPGSPIPMYLAGAKMVSAVPMGPTIDAVGLTVTASSSDAFFSIGYHGCGEAVADKEALVAGTHHGFAALKKAAAAKKPASVKKTPVKKSTAKKKPVAKKVIAKKSSPRAKAVKK